MKKKTKLTFWLAPLVLAFASVMILGCDDKPGSTGRAQIELVEDWTLHGQVDDDRAWPAIVFTMAHDPIGVCDHEGVIFEDGFGWGNTGRWSND